MQIAYYYYYYYTFDYFWLLFAVTTVDSTEYNTELRYGG